MEDEGAPVGGDKPAEETGQPLEGDQPQVCCVGVLSLLEELQKSFLDNVDRWWFGFVIILLFL